MESPAGCCAPCLARRRSEPHLEPRAPSLGQRDARLGKAFARHRPPTSSRQYRHRQHQHRQQHRVQPDNLLDFSDPSTYLQQRDYHGGEGILLRKGVFKRDSQQVSTCECWRLDPFASEGWHRHFRENSIKGSGNSAAYSGTNLEEIYVVLKGSATIEWEGCNSLLRLSTGRAVRFSPEVYHSVKNSSTTDFLYLLVIWGPPHHNSQEYRGSTTPETAVSRL